MKSFLWRHKVAIIFSILMLSHIFLRCFLLFTRANLGWDQIDSAWAAKEILIGKHFLLQGPVAKGNSGIYMGPLYFYLISIVYFFTHLDPIASPIFAVISGLTGALVVYFVTKKIFGATIALIALFINTFSFTIIDADRVQSAYYFIPVISYLLFYCLFKILTGKENYIYLLAIFLGLSFHVDFTSIFYPIMIVFSLPFVPWNKKMIRNTLLALPLFFLFLLPIGIQTLSSKRASTQVNYLQTFYHGFHVIRFLQLSHDAFIYFEALLQFKIFRPFVFLIPPIFFYLYYKIKPTKDTLKLFYLIALWILIPWIILSTYSGELTSYYFSPSKYIIIAIFAFLTWWLLSKRNIFIKIVPILFWAIYTIQSLQQFYQIPQGNLLPSEQSVKNAIASKRVIPFVDHRAESYIYYIYTRDVKKK